MFNMNMKLDKTPGGKNYSLEPHALNRMAQRKINRQDIEKVLDSYDTSHTDIKGNLCLIGDLPGRGRLRIVIAKDSDPLVIITVIVIS